MIDLLRINNYVKKCEEKKRGDEKGGNEGKSKKKTSISWYEGE